MRCILKTGLLGLLCCTWILLTTFAYGKQPYLVETSASYYSLEDDDDNEAKGYGLGLTCHFAPVNVSNHPLAEAAFMERIGGVSVFAGRQEFDFGSGAEADGPIYGIGLLYAQPAQPLVAQAYLVKEEAEFDAPSQAEISADTYGVGIGAYLQDGVIVMLAYERSEIDRSAPGLSIPEIEHDVFAIEAKWVSELTSNKAINLQGGIGLDEFDTGTEDGSNTIFGIAADYYFNSYVSAGGRLELNTGDDEDDEGNTIEVRCRVFLHPQFSIAGEYEHFSADNKDTEDEDSFEITLAVRF